MDTSTLLLVDTVMCKAEPNLAKVNQTIWDILTQTCEEISYIPETQTLIVSDESFQKLATETDSFINQVSDNLDLSREQTVNYISNFFDDRTLLVQLTGIEGITYQVGMVIEASLPSVFVARTLVIARAAGITRLQIIQAQPIFIIILPTVGGLFFHGVGSLVGNNTIGRTCKSIGNILNIPLYYCEQLYNVYIEPAVNKKIGLATTFNYIQQVMLGSGLTSKEALNLIQQNQKDSLIKIVKCWCIKRLRGKC